MSSSNCWLLTCIQISQEAGKVVWYSHLLKNFPQFVVIYTVKGFGVINKAEVDVFLELSCFFDDPADVGNLISGSSAVSKTSLNIWKFTVHILLKLFLCSVQWLSCVWLFATPGTVARQASLSITNLEFTQTHVHWVVDAIQISHPLSSPSPPAFNLSQQQGLFRWVCTLCSFPLHCF